MSGTEPEQPSSQPVNTNTAQARPDDNSPGAVEDRVHHARERVAKIEHMTADHSRVSRVVDGEMNRELTDIANQANQPGANLAALNAKLEAIESRLGPGRSGHGHTAGEHRDQPQNEHPHTEVAVKGVRMSRELEGGRIVREGGKHVDYGSSAENKGYDQLVAFSGGLENGQATGLPAAGRGQQGGIGV